MMKKTIHWLMANEQGQGMLEYSLILVIISLAFILVLGALGSGAAEKYSTINNTMPQ